MVNPALNYSFSIATKKDDAGIRKLMSENPMPGHIQFSFEANPSFFDSLPIHGYKNTVIVAKDKSDSVLGFGVKSTQKIFLEGKSSDVGYLSMLRIDKKHRGKKILINGMAFLQKLESKDKVKLSFTFIVNKNVVAKKIFLSKKIGFPLVYDLGNINTYILFLDDGGLKNSSTNLNDSKELRIRKALKSDTDEIITFVNKYVALKNFFPTISKKDFLLNESLFPETFFMAYKNKELVGITSVWDQSEIRQTIVRGYSFPMKIYTKIYNFYAKCTSRKAFPEINKPFNYIYLNNILVKGNDCSIFRGLLDTVLKEYSAEDYLKYHCCVFALHEKDVLNSVLSDYRKISYKSTMYLLSWKAQDKLFNRLKNLPIYVDIARA